MKALATEKTRREQPKPLERLLALEEVAEFLGVPVRTLYTWRYKGEGPPAFKVGRHLRYDPVALRRWLVEQM
jgi:predicted DNA-binding transcriptional regulator AlpA